jgi:tRNA pseudouridine38-40 synthase
MRFKLTIAYDGFGYQGFQSQKNGLGIQTVLEETLSKIAKEKIEVVASGRTDKGVHALGQVCHFDTNNHMSESAWLRALNTYLPNDIVALDINKTTDDFHARFSVVKKSYVYVISKDYNVFRRHYETFIKYPLDVNLMMVATQKLAGTHDFKGFGVYVEHKPTIKTLFEATLEETDTHYIFTFVADGFLKYMVRSMVGTILDIGRGKIPVTVIDDILENQDRSKVGKTAAPEGLYLKQVWY